jgi:hypothetical protein
MDQSCRGFVQVSRKWAPGVRLDHVSVYDGPQWAMIIKIFKVFSIFLISKENIYSAV